MVTDSTVGATIGGTAKFVMLTSPTNAKVEWTRSGVSFPESDGGHYDVTTETGIVKNGVQYRRDTLKISNVQSSDTGTYEATATYSDGKYTKTESMTLTNSGANVVSEESFRNILIGH
eukprot:sb/3476415/